MSFRTIAGHRRILTLLSRSVERGSLPPSLIFCGPEGVGKRRAALATAAALNCTAPVRGSVDFEREACGKCGACRRILRGVHPDVQVVVPGETGSIKIEQIRDVIDSATYRPFEGARRVTVIDDADALMPAAQNALLKTLEEPPSASVFVLVASRQDALLPTVRSRCSQLRFSRLETADVAAVLERDHGYSRPDALAAAAMADGSVGRALDARTTRHADAREAAALLLREAAGPRDPRARLERAKELVKGGSSASEREHLGDRLRALSSLLRDLGILATGADARLLANLDLRPGLDGLAKSYDSERASRAFAAVDRAHDALERNVSPKVVADWVALQL